MRRALENTCLPLKEGSPDAILTHGRGLLQVSLDSSGNDNELTKVLYDLRALHAEVNVNRLMTCKNSY